MRKPSLKGAGKLPQVTLIGAGTVLWRGKDSLRLPKARSGWVPESTGNVKESAVLDEPVCEKSPPSCAQGQISGGSVTLGQNRRLREGLRGPFVLSILGR